MFSWTPSVGKTSLENLLLKLQTENLLEFFRGIRDEAEIRGHRRTYIGSLPVKLYK